jgi:hypothetical protein
MASPGGAPRRALTARDLAEEGKKRAVLLLVFAFGLAFLMSRESLSPALGRRFPRRQARSPGANCN